MLHKPIIFVAPERLSNGLLSAVGICKCIREAMEDVSLDLSNCEFVTPSFVVPLLVYLKSKPNQVQIVNTSKYLDRIQFREYGVASDEMSGPEFSAYMSAYSPKSYIPIVRFSTKSNRSVDIGIVLSVIENLLVRQTNISNNVLFGIKYMLGELTDNISEHSRSESGYIFAQAYPNLGYIDICLADTGVTLLGSYSSLGGVEIDSDIEAMRAATKGISTKNLPDAENRGYGIITSVAMAVKGLHGSFMMISGNACYGTTINGSAYVGVPDNIHFKGTIISLRIPCDANLDFNYMKYIV